MITGIPSKDYLAISPEKKVPQSDGHLIIVAAANMFSPIIICLDNGLDLTD